MKRHSAKHGSAPLKKIGVLLTIIGLGLGCQKPMKGDVAYVIDEKDLIPEGIAYSSTTRSFYLSSIHKTKIIRVNAATGTYQDFIAPDVLGMAVLGLAVDEANRCLWACAESLDETPCRATVARFDLLSGELLSSHESRDSLRFTNNDLALDARGNVYYTNRANHRVQKIHRADGRVETVFQGAEIEYPNGITLSPDDRYLYVASGTRGIRVVELASRKIVNRETAVFDSKGIDGLKFHDQSLVAVQNGVADPAEIKIVRYRLDSTLTRIIGFDIIDQNNPGFDVPTTLVVVDDAVYCIANSQLSNFSPEGIRDPLRLTDVTILRYGL